VVEAIAAAIPLGLDPPIVYNTSGYDSLASLRLLKGLVDIYMPRLQVLGAGDRPAAGSGRRHPVRAREAIA
jgi:putative pyruvate formate lyase activating enzyme